MKNTNDISTPSITPVLAGWFKSGMIETREDDVVTLDGTPIDNLQIIGRLIESDVQTTKVFIKVEDGTDIVEFVVNKRVEETLPRQLEGIDLSQTDEYLRIVFTPQVYKNKITNVVNKVEPVTNHNAITFHMLQTVYSAKYRAEGNSVNLKYEQHVKDQGMRQKSSGNGARISNGTHANGINRMQGGAEVNSGRGMKMQVQDALRQLKQSNRGSNFTFNQIRNKIGKGVDVNLLRRALEQLMNDGVLFEEEGMFDLL